MVEEEEERQSGQNQKRNEDVIFYFSPAGIINAHPTKQEKADLLYDSF